jgi:hypothetical protein
MQRHREMYGDHSSEWAAADQTFTWSTKKRIPYPEIFLEDENCSKCTVLQHQLDTVTQRLHALRIQQQHRDALSPPPKSEPPGVVMGGRASDTCSQCDELGRQVRSLSDRLHAMRMRQQQLATASAGVGPSTASSPPVGVVKWVDRHKDMAVNTDLDSRGFADLQTFFLLENL